jgi:hypothetical protein
LRGLLKIILGVEWSMISTNDGQTLQDRFNQAVNWEANYGNEHVMVLVINISTWVANSYYNKEGNELSDSLLKQLFTEKIDAQTIDPNKDVQLQKLDHIRRIREDMETNFIPSEKHTPKYNEYNFLQSIVDEADVQLITRIKALVGGDYTGRKKIEKVIVSTAKTLLQFSIKNHKSLLADEQEITSIDRIGLETKPIAEAIIDLIP